MKPIEPVWTPDDFMALWDAIQLADPELPACPVIDLRTRERLA